MKRIFALVLSCLILISLFCGCQAAQEELPAVPKDKREPIRQAFMEMLNSPYTVWFDEGYGFGMFYLGECNGYDVVYKSMVCFTTEENPVHQLVLGEVTIENACTSDLWTYKDGKLVRLEEVFREGKIDRTQIQVLKDQFNKCYQKELDAREYANSEGMDKYEKDFGHLYEVA